MMQQGFKTTNRGALFVRQKYKETSPDVGGDIDIGGDVLQHILASVNGGATEVKIGLIGYKRNTKNGTPMTSLTAVIPQDRPAPYQGGRMRVEDIPRQTQFPQQRGGFNRNAYAQQSGGYANNPQSEFPIQTGTHAHTMNRPMQEATVEPRQRAGVSGGQGMFTNDDLNDEIPW